MKDIIYEDEILVKYNKSNYVPFCIYFILYSIFYVYVKYIETCNFFQELTMILLGIAMLNAWFCEAFVIRFNKDGCEIKNLIFRKKFKWDEIKTIKYEYYSQYKYERGKYNSIPNLKSCIVFSCIPHPKPEWREPYISTTVFKPFNIFYVNFINESNNDDKKIKYNYLINESLFLNKLVEWGVKVEGLNDPPKQYVKKNYFKSRNNKIN